MSAFVNSYWRYCFAHDVAPPDLSNQADIENIIRIVTPGLTDGDSKPFKKQSLRDAWRYYRDTFRNLTDRLHEFSPTWNDEKPSAEEEASYAKEIALYRRMLKGLAKQYVVLCRNHVVTNVYSRLARLLRVTIEHRFQERGLDPMKKRVGKGSRTGEGKKKKSVSEKEKKVSLRWLCGHLMNELKENGQDAAFSTPAKMTCFSEVNLSGDEDQVSEVHALNGNQLFGSNWTSVQEWPVGLLSKRLR